MATDTEVVDEAIAQHRALAGALLPILHAIHDRLGFIPPASHEKIAAALSLSRAEVHGVVTFYHDFRSAPPERHVLKVCRAEACQSMGSEALEARLAERAAKGLTVESVYCLGNCACAPALVLDGRLHGRVTRERLDALIDQMEPS